MVVDTAALKAALRSKDGARLRLWLDICARCGLCARACHFFQSDPKPEYTPAYRMKPLLEVFAKKDKISEESLQWLRDVDYGTCTMCQRCSMYCPYGISIAFLVRAARSIAVSQGLIPEGLVRGMENHYEFGNNLALTEEDYLETIEWQLEEVQEELPDAQAPMDKENADVLITFHPRDIKFYPQNLYSYLKIYNASKENFTFSSKGWDSTNIGLFSGDDRAAKHFSGLVIEAGERLHARRVATAE